MLTKLQFDRAIKRNKQPNYILQSNSNTIAPSLQAYESGSEESYDDFEEDFEIDINDNSNSDEAHSTFGIYYNSKYSSTFTKFIRKHSPTNSSSYDIFDLPIQSFNNINAGEQILLPIIDSYIQPNDFFRDSILSSFPEEEEISSKNRSKRKKRKPETISYLETIPKQYQQTIIQNISTNLIKKYIFTNCNQIIRTNLQAKKKQIQEQLLKEKEQRQRNEEKQRLIAMRERRKQKINEYSTKLQEPLIKTFIRNEIHNIYNEEIENNNSLYNLKNINLEYNNVVIVHGLVLRKHLNIEFLENAFNTLAFETDEDGNPKIRFIYYENRIMPLLFLANLDEVKKALSMSFGMFESSVVRLSRFDDSNGDEIIKLFTGQQIVKKIAKNFNEINENGGKNVLKEMSPIINLDK